MKTSMYKVEDILKMPIANISETILKFCYFTNDELTEIILKFEDMYLNGKTTLYEKLIRTQQGPFNREIFNLFSKYYLSEKFGVQFAIAVMLLEKTDGVLTEEDLLSWFKNAYNRAPKTFIADFIDSDLAKKHGIDAKVAPWNKKLPLALIKYGNVGDENIQAVCSCVDNLSDKEKLEWYFDMIDSVHMVTKTTFMLAYENSTPEMIEDFYYNRVESQHKEKLAKHKNASEEIKLEMYQKTGDDAFLPSTITDIFCF